MVDIFLYNINKEIGNNVVVTKNLPTQNLKVGMTVKREKKFIGKKICLKFPLQPSFTKNWSISDLILINSTFVLEEVK